MRNLRCHAPLPASQLAPSDDRPEVTSLYEQARWAWPGVEVPEPTFFAAVKARLAQEGQDGLDGVDPAEIYVATACAAGSSTAIRAFEERYSAPSNAWWRAWAEAWTSSRT